jgi:hypothetical protein
MEEIEENTEFDPATDVLVPPAPPPPTVTVYVVFNCMLD